jgi:hypothetical protein
LRGGVLHADALDPPSCRDRFYAARKFFIAESAGITYRVADAEYHAFNVVVWRLVQDCSSKYGYCAIEQNDGADRNYDRFPIRKPVCAANDSKHDAKDRIDALENLLAALLCRHPHPDGLLEEVVQA